MSRIVRIWILAAVLQAASAAQLGARLDVAGQNITFRVHSSAAGRIEVWVYDQPLGAQERLSLPLSADPATKIWAVTIPVSTLRTSGVTGAVYYGYRAWGPNWTFDPAWTKGSGVGFQQDVDAQGNRFNPNKLLLDPVCSRSQPRPAGTDFAGKPDGWADPPIRSVRSQHRHGRRCSERHRDRSGRDGSCLQTGSGV